MAFDRQIYIDKVIEIINEMRTRLSDPAAATEDLAEGLAVAIEESLSTSSGGHVIQDKNGTNLPNRVTLQFKGGVNVTDDSVNSKTVVDIGGLSFTDLVSILQEGVNITLDIDTTNQTITINSDQPETDPIFSAWLASNPTSGTNTGDQVVDGVTITGTGTTANPFVAVGGELAKRFDYVSRNLYYRGTAPAGSLDDAPVWSSKKVEVLDNGSIENITEVTNYKWTERNLI